MKLLDDAIPSQSTSTVTEAISSVESRWTQFTSRFVDRMNPILVKETRQALKSHQFIVTLQLVLLAILVWTLLGTSLLSPQIFYAPTGPQMLIGYMMILLVPTGIIVPMATYRSMSNEVEHGTFEVLSISTLSANQIVTGKVAVAALQTLLYLSALAPCISVTYLLRGLSISTLLIVLGSSFLLSLVLSCFSVFAATLGKRFSRLIVITMLMQLLFTSTVTLIMGIMLLQMISMNWIPDDMGQWFGIVAAVVAALSYSWLFLRLAAANISFESDNHSTAIRWSVWGQHALFVSIFVMMQVFVVDYEVWMVLFTILGVHWSVFGAFSICESGMLSPRAQRQLPTTIASRLFLTWFSPGPGTGYIFCVVSYFSALIGVILLPLFIHRLSSGSNQSEAIDYGLLVGSYIAVYLGITRLILLAFQPWLRNRVVSGLAILATLLMMGIIIPMMYSYLTETNNQIKYTPVAILNVTWSLTKMYEVRASGGMLFFSLAAAIVFQINLLLVSKDVMLVRIAAPERVQKELAPSGSNEPAVDPLAV